MAALADSLAFELWTVKPPIGDFGASLARHGVHDLRRAHYRRGSAPAQDVLGRTLTFGDQKIHLVQAHAMLVGAGVFQAPGSLHQTPDGFPG